MWTPRTCSCSQQFGLPRRQAWQFPQLEVRLDGAAVAGPDAGAGRSFQDLDAKFMAEDARVTEERLPAGESVQVGAADADAMDTDQGVPGGAAGGGASALTKSPGWRRMIWRMMDSVSEFGAAQGGSGIVRVAAASGKGGQREEGRGKAKKPCQHPGERGQ